MQDLINTRKFVYWYLLPQNHAKSKNYFKLSIIMVGILNSSCMSRCLYLEHSNSISHHIKSDINWLTTVIPYPH